MLAERSNITTRSTVRTWLSSVAFAQARSELEGEEDDEPTGPMSVRDVSVVGSKPSREEPHATRSRVDKTKIARSLRRRVAPARLRSEEERTKVMCVRRP